MLDARDGGVGAETVGAKIAVTSNSCEYSVVAIAAPLATTFHCVSTSFFICKRCCFTNISSYWISTTSPEMKSKTVAQSAVAVTLTFLETAVSFSIVT